MKKDISLVCKPLNRSENNLFWNLVEFKIVFLTWKKLSENVQLYITSNDKYAIQFYSRELSVNSMSYFSGSVSDEDEGSEENEEKTSRFR